MLLSFALISVVISCRKFVEVPSPTQSLVTGNVFDKNTTATAAQLSIYAQMQGYSTRFNFNTGLSSDEFTTNSSTSTTINLYKNALSEASDSPNLGLWNQGYSYIYQCNAVIEGLMSSNTISSSVKKQLTGEAKFLRSYLYLDLLGAYGDIPLILSTNYANNVKIAKTAQSTVLQQIISDLKDSQLLLNEKYVDASDTVATNTRVRPNKWAATALLARAYLYTSNWTDAETQASSIIANTAIYSLPTDLNSVFLIAGNNSTEAIWQLQTNSNNSYTSDASQFVLTGDINTGGNANIPLINPSLLAAFEPGDKRRSSWINSLSASSGTYYYAYKYKVTSASIPTEYSTLLRLAEQYLIRAEARAKLNKLAEALSDLNVIRLRAGLSSLPLTLNQNQVLLAVAQERRTELFTEGHRWLDLKRTGTIDDVMSLAAPQKGGTWAVYKQLYPIPIKDIQNSAGVIIQNQGY